MVNVGALPPHVVRGLGTAIGLASGFVAARLADAMPRRYDITHVTTGAKRTRRNAAIITLGAACGWGLGNIVSGVPEASVGIAAFYVATNIVLIAALLAAAAVDLEHMILPNEVTLGGAALALATAHWRPLGLTGALIGAGLGFALSYVPFLIYKQVRGRSGMGLGDAKLAILAGAWLGPEGAVWVLFAGALQSALTAGILRAAGLKVAVPASVTAEIARLRAKAEAGDAEAAALLADDPMAAEVHDGFATMRLPLGPFLVLACLEFLFAKRWIVSFVAGD